MREKGNISVQLEEIDKINRKFKRIKQMESVSIEIIEKTFKRTATFNFEEDKHLECKIDNVAEKHCNLQ